MQKNVARNSRNECSPDVVYNVWIFKIAEKRVKTKKHGKKPPVDWNRNGNESVFFHMLRIKK